MTPQSILAAIAVAFLLSSIPAQSPTPGTTTSPSLSAVLDRGFGNNNLWDDGQAEVATYDASTVVYGKPRAHTLRLITVYEDFNREYYAKADWPYGQKPILPVIKQIQTTTIPTANYDYHFLTAVFVDRDDFGRTVKLTTTSQDWCGTTSKTFELWGEKPRMIYTSYWDGEGNGTRELGSNIDDYFEEDLLLNLRALPFRDGLNAAFWLYPKQATNKAPEPRPVPAYLIVSRQDQAWDVLVEARDARTIRYEFEPAYPHVLKHYEHSDGTTLTLKKLERYAYWIQKD